MASHDDTKKADKKALQGQFDALRKRFIQRFSADSERLLGLTNKVEAQLEKACSAENRGVLELTLGEMRHLLHSLAGTSGTFGFMETGEEARSLLSSLDAQIAERHPALNEISPLLERIRAFASQPLEFDRALPGTITNPDQVPRQNKATGLADNKLAWILGSEASFEGLQESLGAFGFKLHPYYELGSLTRAYREAKDQVPTLVLLDLDALSLNLRDAVPCVTLDDAHSRPPTTVIAYSDVDDFNHRLLAARLGAAYFMMKPLDFAQVFFYLLRDSSQGVQGCPRVMIVEDDPILAGYLTSSLQNRGIESTVLEEPGAIIDRAAAFNPDLVLMDLDLGRLAGDELAAILRQKEEFRSLPIVYLSAETNEARQLQALSRGADDFLRKPVDANALVMSVQSRIRRYRELRDMIDRDGMTGLLKHSSFLSQAEGLLSLSHREDKPLAFVMVDIDWFKRVNDTYGHGVGDTVIKALASLLRQSVRQADLVGRYGGEEFVLALLGCSPEEARVKMEDLRQRFSHLEFQAQGGVFHCSLSLGIAVRCRNTDRQVPDYVELADQALYRAKKSGRNRLTVVTS